jgi:hypothetical protein
MRFPRLVPSPALVVACLALVVAAAQPVASAVGALVPNNSVGTAQLKDGAVTTPKLHGSAVTSGKIANGTVGLLDLASAARPKPPKAYRDSAEGQVTLPADGSRVILADLDLPVGSWVLIGKSMAITSSGITPNSVTCNLVVDDIASIDSATASMSVNQNWRQTLPLTTFVTGPVHVDLGCWDSDDAVSAKVAESRLVAIKVTP